MSTWLVIAGVAAVAFMLRASFIVFADPHRFPHAFRRALQFVPPAVLAAIVMPGLAMPAGSLELGVGNPRWIAGVAAIAIAARTRSALAAIAGGMVLLWMLQWVLRAAG
jgi:branched-subunit amino acid transport protein